ncbi:MAG: SusD/RagB family nutrient-binding outer membrane lipoprotein [Chitinophagaceae bacterium]
MIRDRAKFATEARNKTGNAVIGYRGIPSGYTGSENQFDYIPSILQVGLVTAPMIVPIMPYAEVEFIRAELELKSELVLTAKSAYERGVKAAIEQWGVVMPADYFTNTIAAYNNTLERIMLQNIMLCFLWIFNNGLNNAEQGFLYYR